jgi:trk system potassium uptake protein TrkH
MILGSIAFPIHYLVLQGDLRHLYEDLQTRWVFGFFALGTVVLVGFLLGNGVYAPGRSSAPETVSLFAGTVVLDGGVAEAFTAVRYGLFQFVSAASCTGFQTATNLGTAWSAEAQLTVALGMVVGAAAGSTVGGIKLIRALTLVKGTVFRIRGVFYPDNAIRTFRLDGRALNEEEATREFEEAAIIAFLWVVTLGIGLVVLLLTVPASFTLENVVFEVASAQGNVGLSTGITGPGMPTIPKLMLVFNRWIGRLEIIPVLVLLRALFTRFEVYP